MLQITIPKREIFDQETQTFIQVKETHVTLEHSLVALSKWESKWHKAFLKPNQELSDAELLDYIRCMTITQNVDPISYHALTQENIAEIRAYIEDPMTATHISNYDRHPASREVVTSELIYYWMIACQIPMECQKWHLNRLMALIKVCQVKMNPEKQKMSKAQIMARNSKLNAARRAKMHSKG